MTPADKAAELWPLIVRKPSPLDVYGSESMPVWAAVDLVTEETGGDRAAAAVCLIEVAVGWLEKLRPVGGSTEGGYQSLKEPSSVVLRLLGKSKGIAVRIILAHMLKMIRNYALPGTDLWRLEQWRLWVLEARRVVELLRPLL